MEPAEIRLSTTQPPVPKLTDRGIARPLLESSRQAIFLETLTGEILDCTCTACQFFGYAEKAELTACQVSDIVPEKAAATLSAVMTAELATEGACLESWGRRKDGSLFPIQVSMRLINYEGEQLVVAYIHDITVAKDLERKQKERQELTAALVTAAAVVNSHLKPDEVLDRILEQVARVVNGEA
ncbi:MAG: PAS domain S-box protein, partial [Chloroflexota bacterium]|nr:PAS domain S-box protein [Chloroflexota bacterium]